MILERLEITGFGCLHEVTTELHPRSHGHHWPQRVRASPPCSAPCAVRCMASTPAGRVAPSIAATGRVTSPGTAAGYGLALTYKLDDGRRIRVARRLDTREQSVQVLELGGSELTDELRSGRAVTPGRFHLGIDESVFCATAWLGDDGLRIDAPESARQRAGQLQEAIERLADTRRGVTAAQALVRIRDAMDRVGSERRTTSPLGVASRAAQDARAHHRGRPHPACRRRRRPGASCARLTRRSTPRPSTGSRRERARIAGRLSEVAEPPRSPWRDAFARRSSRRPRSTQRPRMRVSRSTSRPR